MGLILLIVLLILLFGTLPTWGYSRDWGFGYRPTGLLAALLIILILLMLTGHVVF